MCVGAQRCTKTDSETHKEEGNAQKNKASEAAERLVNLSAHGSHLVSPFLHGLAGVGGLHHPLPPARAEVSGSHTDPSVSPEPLSPHASISRLNSLSPRSGDQ